MVATSCSEKDIYGEFFEIIEDFPLRNGITNVDMGDFGFNSQSFQEMENQHLRLLEVLESSSLHRLIPEHGKEWFFVPKTKLTLNYYGGDILISEAGEENRVLACPTADCPTLIISANDKTFAAIVHCGYRSIQKGVIPTAFKLVNEVYPMEDIKIGLFPGICGNCYKVGPEFVGGFFDEHLSSDRKLDLEKVILHECLDRGVKEENITICGYCSAHNVHNGDFLFFSYRRDNTSRRNLVFTII